MTTQEQAAWYRQKIEEGPGAGPARPPGRETSPGKVREAMRYSLLSGGQADQAHPHAGLL